MVCVKFRICTGLCARDCASNYKMTNIAEINKPLTVAFMASSSCFSITRSLEMLVKAPLEVLNYWDNSQYCLEAPRTLEIPLAPFEASRVHGYKLQYFGVIHDVTMEVEGFDNQLGNFTIIWTDDMIDFFCTYVQQKYKPNVRLTPSILHKKTSNVLPDEYIGNERCFDGHVDRRYRGATSFGTRNKGDERIFDFRCALDVVFFCTWFIKRLLTLETMRAKLNDGDFARKETKWSRGRRPLQVSKNAQRTPLQCSESSRPISN